MYQLTPVPRTEEYDNISTAQKFGYISGDIIGNSGHLRITVFGEVVTVDYVRAYVPKDETDECKNRQVGCTYTIQSQW